jgi:hypothetical protein
MARPQLTSSVVAFNIDYPLGFENSRSGANSTAPTRPNSRIGTRPGSALSTHAGDDPMQSQSLESEINGGRAQKGLTHY